MKDIKQIQEFKIKGYSITTLGWLEKYNDGYVFYRVINKLGHISKTSFKNKWEFNKYFKSK